MLGGQSDLSVGVVLTDREIVRLRDIVRHAERDLAFLRDLSQRCDRLLEPQLPTAADIKGLWRD